MSNLFTSVKRGSQWLAEKLTGHSVIGRSPGKQRADMRRRRKAVRFDLPDDLEQQTSSRKRMQTRAQSGRASTLLNDDDRLGG